jgi:hypothetical protein
LRAGVLLILASAARYRELHQHFVAAMISGDLTELEQWLDARHDPGCFASTLRAPAWNPAAGRES